MTDRKPGWYWVKVTHGGNWSVHKFGRFTVDADFDVIGPYIPTPDEVTHETLDRMAQDAIADGTYDAPIGESHER